MLSSVEQNRKALIVRRLTSADEASFLTAIRSWTELGVRTIEACGGILENTVDADGGKLRKRRYWINIER